jgi:hypothetical protein
MNDVDVSIDAVNSAHYVDWGAIIAGGFIAIAISSVFLAFGSAVGLSLTSFQSGNSASMTGLAIAATLWLLWVQVSSFVGGSYVTGRLRRRIGDATAHEAEMRDGSHGLIVWAVGVVVGTAIASWLATSGLTGAATVGATDYYVDKMIRSDTAVQADPANDTVQISRVLAKNLALKVMDDSDKTYLVREIAARSGLPEAEAQKRLDETMLTLKAQADSARRYGILIAFLTAASILVSAVASWWAACAGGKHRNEGVDHTHLMRWR